MASGVGGGQERGLGAKRERNRLQKKKSRRAWTIVMWGGGIIIVLALITAWVGYKALSVRDDLDAATRLIPTLKDEVSSGNLDRASKTVESVRAHTSAARATVEDPIWTLASTLPLLGSNLRAVSEVARSADDVTTLGMRPLIKVYGSLNWDRLLPGRAETDLAAFETASPSVTAAARAVGLSANRLNEIDESTLVPQVAQPLVDVRNQLKEATVALEAAADASDIAPGMMGSEAPRNYLLIIQNNSEVRASGGIPGALAVLTFDNGKLSLGAQGSAGDIGIMDPILPLDPQQQQIYSSRLGKYMQDVNLTPDFPTAAATAQAMWEKKKGQRVDGVISVDPVVLGYILGATGPVAINGPASTIGAAVEMPTELTGSNVVPTLLRDVYAKIEQPRLQDEYFAGVAKEVFSALSAGKGEGKGLISGITRGVEERRVLVWASDPVEQRVIAKYALSGSIAGPSISPAQFGVYFNDGTGAKMDYYVKRTVQLVKECPVDGYEQTTVRVTSTNTAPTDAATSLPAYVTGGGSYGVPPGSIQTNIVAYGPPQAVVESARVGGQRTAFAPYLHADRPVGVLAQRLAPGESATIEFTFGKIVQHSEPNLAVTPSIQPVKEVHLPTKNASCGGGG